MRENPSPNFHFISSIFELIEAVKTDPSSETRRKLIEWMDYSSDLGKHMQSKHSINSTSRGVRLQYSLEEIAKYQKIKEEDMQAAPKVCGKELGPQARSVVNCCYCLKRRAQRDSGKKTSQFGFKESKAQGEII